MPGLNLTGLLPGVEAVRLGTCDATEFEQHGDQILKGPRGNSQVVVKPADGYEFRFEIISNSYRPVMVLASKRTYTVKIEATTQQDAAHIEAIKRLPGVVSFEETTPAPLAPIDTTEA